MRDSPEQFCKGCGHTIKMHELTFLQDLAVVMSAAALATLLFRQFKQPVVLGYIIAGVIIGPHTPLVKPGPPVHV